MAKKMNVRVKALWIEHLLSDWYDQNFDYDDQGLIPLRTENDKWSPFGVLCNIHAQTFPQVAMDQLEKTVYLEHECLLPHNVAVWAGVKDRGCSVDLDGSFLFDGKRYTNIEDMFMDGIPFFVIADAIAEKL